MAELLPINIPFIPDTAVASLGTPDFIQGVGYITFYAADVNDGTYILTQNQIYSERVTTDSGSVSCSASFALKFERNFDIVIQTPLRLKGELQANIPLAIVDAGGSVGTQAYVIVKIIKYDGSETVIASAQGRTVTAGTSATESYMTAVRLTVPETLIKATESIRMSVEVWAKADSGTENATLALGIDPQNREDTSFFTGDSMITQMIFNIPFKIDL